MAASCDQGITVNITERIIALKSLGEVESPGVKDSSRRRLKPIPCEAFTRRKTYNVAKRRHGDHI